MNTFTIFSLFTGFLIQTIPFAILSISPIKGNCRWNNRITLIATALLLFILGGIFTGICCFLYHGHETSPAVFGQCNTVFILLLIPCILYYFAIIRTTWEKKLFIISYSLTMAMLITTITNIIDSNDPWTFPEDNLPYPPLDLVYLSGATLVILPFFYYILHKYYLSVADALNRRLSKHLSVISIVLFAILAIFVSPIDYTGIANNQTELGMVVYFLLSIPLIYIFMFQILYFCFQSDQLSASLNHAFRQLDIQHEQYKYIKNNIDINRRFRHDMHHNLHVLQGFLAKGDVDAAATYLQKYNNSLLSLSLKTYCEHDTINILLQYYAQQFNSLHIPFHTHIKCPAELPIEKADLSVILGNLLDNALDALKDLADLSGCADSAYIIPTSDDLDIKTESRFVPMIRLHIIQLNNSLVITLDNDFDGKIKVGAKHLLTTKNGHSGLGLTSIESISAKYQGKAEFSYEAKKTESPQNPIYEFHSSVVLYF